MLRQQLFPTCPVEYCLGITKVQRYWGRLTELFFIGFGLFGDWMINKHETTQIEKYQKSI